MIGRLLVVYLLSLWMVGAVSPEQARGEQGANTSVEQKQVADNSNLFFKITRSKNRNEVVYEARRSADGFDTQDPIKVYWIMVEEGGRIEGLNSIEKRSAYGISIESASPDKVLFHLKAIKEREIEGVYDKQEGRSRALMNIQGEPCYLESVYIQAEERSLNPIPKVLYIDIKGRSTKTGKEVSERIQV